MSDKYKVAVHGLMKKNGQMASFGDELTDELHIDDAAKKVKEGYLLPSDEFDAARKKEADDLKESSLTPEEKAQRAAEEKKAADALKAHNDLLAKYNTAFGSEAPADATDEAISDAIKNKKAIGS